MKRKLILVWILLMIAGVFTAGCTYVAFQQSQRLNAYQPAVTAAKQAVFGLKRGQKPKHAIPIITDVSTNTPFVIIYDSNKKFVVSSANVADMGFQYPSASLDYINKQGENRITWQPKTGYRYATAGIKYKNYYVIGAYSLKEAENTTATFATILFVGSVAYAAGSWILLMVLGTIALVSKDKAKRKKAVK